MEILNKSTKKVIAKDCKLCRSILSKAKGLMVSKKRNLIFDFNEEKRVSLHMLFVFFPIWAVYLNSKKEVVFIKKLYPLISMCNPKEKACYILELVEQPNLKIGDLLSW